MSALLLDTHAVIWAINEPSKLSERARTLISDPDHSLAVSAASAWEIATKHRLGKLPHAEPWIPHFREQVAWLGASTLPITMTHALRAGSLEWEHRDPFDRMIAAQAQAEDLTLVSRDPAFRTLPQLSIVW